MSKQKQYRVTWSIDVESEDVNTPVEAIEDCWKRLHEHGNDWVWEVIDIQEGKTYEIDYDTNPWEYEIREVTDK